MKNYAIVFLFILSSTLHADGVNGGGIYTTSPTSSPIPDARFTGFLSTPVHSNLASGGDHKINTILTGGADKLSFTFGDIGSNTEKASLDENGNLDLDGTLSASNFSGTCSGTNSGDQTISLTGDVVGSGTGSFSATIQSNAVALATDTTGNYVATAVGDGNNLSVSGSGSENANITVSISSTPNFTSVQLNFVSSLGTCNSSAAGLMKVYRKGSGITESTSLCICEETLGAYGWRPASTVGDCS